MTFDTAIAPNSLKSKDAFACLVDELKAEVSQMEQEQTKTEIGAAGKLISLMQGCSGDASVAQESAPKGYGAALLAMEQQRQIDQP